jgi:hypothetical protein
MNMPNLAACHHLHPSLAVGNYFLAFLRFGFLGAQGKGR